MAGFYCQARLLLSGGVALKFLHNQRVIKMPNKVFSLLGAMFLVVFAACSSEDQTTSKTEALSDMQTSVMNGDGTITVVCRNGTRHDSLSQSRYRQLIADDTICEGSGGGGGQSGVIYCKPSGSYYYVTRTSDNQQLGSSVSLDACTQAVRSANRGLACVPSGSYSYLTQISTGQTYGSSVAPSTCVESLQNIAYNIVCVPSGSYFYTTRISDMKQFGSSIAGNTCNQVARRSTRTHFCQPSGSYFYVTDIASGQNLGSSVQLDQCLAALP
jgi:hypothetical protein